ncbi:MAG: Stp1/IreP family PP2C-type Ser/Thr phosphatase [Pseudomonadota bacterium]
MDIQDALEIASLTDQGRVRPHNEDSLAWDAACGLVVLADGMGGYNAGEVASGLAVRALTDGFAADFAQLRAARRDNGGAVQIAAELLNVYVHKANRVIYEMARVEAECAGMGTTLVAGVFCDNKLVTAHVGDSRLYRLRDGQLETVTRDHSLVQEMVDGGLISKHDARRSNNRNLITRALGTQPDVEVEIGIYPVRVGDLYLLCSDGLNDMVEDEEIAEIAEALQANLPLTANHLVQSANDYGGRDNISVLLVKVKADFALPRKWLARWLP